MMAAFQCAKSKVATPQGTLPEVKGALVGREPPPRNTAGLEGECLYLLL